jgi:hypothetical protein
MTEQFILELESRINELARQWFEEAIKKIQLDTLEKCEVCESKPEVLVALCKEHYEKLKKWKKTKSKNT